MSANTDNNGASRLYLTEEGFARMLQNGKTLYAYIIEGRLGILSDSLAKAFKAHTRIENVPEWNIKNRHIAPESIDIWRAFFDAIDHGEQSGSAEVAFVRYALLPLRIPYDLSIILPLNAISIRQSTAWRYFDQRIQ